MKRVLVSALIALAVSATGSAQVSVGWGMQADLVSLNMSGNLSDVYGWGYGGGLHLDVDLAAIDLRFAGDYITASPDNEMYQAKLEELVGNQASQYTVEGGDVTILSASANLKWTILPLPVVSPYLTGGIGLARTGTSSLTVKYQGTEVKNVPEVETETNVLYNLGGGVDIDLAGLTLFVEAKYCWIMTGDVATTYVPITLGITF